MMKSKNYVNANNNNNNNNNSGKNPSGKSARSSRGGRSGSAKNNNSNVNQNNRNNSGKKNSVCSTGSNKNKVQKINNLQAAQQASSGKNSRLESYLASVRDPSIRRWLSKSCTGTSSCNETESKQQQTTLRKRSSLARPVRVHDSFPRDNGPLVIDWSDEQNQQNQQLLQQMQLQRLGLLDEKMRQKQKAKEEKRLRKLHCLENTIDDLVEIRVDEEITTWPLRLRFGELFELSLPRCRRRKRRRRHRMMIATMREKTMKSMMEAGGIGHSNAFKDTDHLLKVLSVNNVDQNGAVATATAAAARCIVM